MGVGTHRLAHVTGGQTSRNKLVLQELLQQTSLSYIVTGRRYGEHSSLLRQSWDFPAQSNNTHEVSAATTGRYLGNLSHSPTLPS